MVSKEEWAKRYVDPETFEDTALKGKYIDPKTFEVNTEGRGRKIYPHREGVDWKMDTEGHHKRHDYQRWIADEVPGKQLCYKCRFPGSGTKSETFKIPTPRCEYCYGSGLLATRGKEE
tara:strand:+ start:486 stop:839 length:354 start_codon:yes stop_codon:yes gene_type:complete